jgi:hypothetical protein
MMGQRNPSSDRVSVRLHTSVPNLFWTVSPNIFLVTSFAMSDAMICYWRTQLTCDSVAVVQTPGE